VLREPAALDALTRAVAKADRLILLGDLLELRHGPAGDALAAAQRPLKQLGEALGADREVVILPGNHDYQVLTGWFDRRAQRARDDRQAVGGTAGSPAPLGLESEVSAVPEEILGRLAALLAPARVRISYPGIWLRDDVYATHGHYADVHMTMPTIERLGAGVMIRIAGRPADQFQAAEDYEAVLAPIYAWIHAMAQRIPPERSGNLNGGSVRGWRAMTGPGRRSLRRRAMTAGFPLLVAGLNRAGVGPLRPELSGSALRRAGLRGMETVATHLGIRAPYVIFGHTHRAGPLPGDDAGEWRLEGGGQLINTGCWVEEASFVGPEPRRSPYRVGFAVWVEDAPAPPRLVNLLDG
jgi:3',5'-cyclic AMP phosphodiesterase CpdA